MKCDNCGGTKFLEGPHGGEAVNFACADCWARYNDLWPFSIERDGFVAEADKVVFNRGDYVPRTPWPKAVKA